MVKPKDKPKVPLGKPLDLSDEDLDRLSQIIPEDIEKVKQLVSQASPKLDALLNAKPITPALVPRAAEHGARESKKKKKP